MAALSKFFLLGLLSLLSLPSSSWPRARPAVPLVAARLKWVYQLRQQVAKRGWPAYRDRRYYGPLAYFTATETYLVNPTPGMIRRFRLRLYYRERALGIYRSPQRLDQQPFHMETAYDERDSTRIYYRTPVMQCSDYETTAQLQPDVRSLQKWASMVLHEYFHGFQLAHPRFLRFANDSVAGSGRQLQALYETHRWYRASVDHENALLLQLLARPKGAPTNSLLQAFVRLREQRRRQAADSLHWSVAQLEDFYEKLEGSARYIEGVLFQCYGQPAARYAYAATDSAYRPGAYARFRLSDEPWLYETNTVRYFYATGFNLLRLLDHLHLPYKQASFTDNQFTPYGLLLRHYGKRLKEKGL